MYFCLDLKTAWKLSQTWLLRFEDSLETFTDLASDGNLLAKYLELDFRKRFANGIKFGVKSLVFLC